MKRLLFFAGMLMMLMAFVSSPVRAVDNDIGLTCVQDIPDQDHGIISNYSTDVLLLDYGDSYVDLMVRSQGIREESPASCCVSPSVDINFESLFHQHWRLYDMNKRHAVTKRIISISNGGAGY